MFRRSHRLTFVALALGFGLSPLTPHQASGQQEAEALSTRFRQASKQTLPAVVTVRPLGVPSPFGDRGLGSNDLADRLVREGGWGVVIDAPWGLVVTNDHVIAKATEGVVVILSNGRERPVSQVWRDPKSDLALLAIDPKDLVAAPWGDDRRLDIGDWVLAIGGPFGLSGTVTAGIVSGKSRGIGVALYEDLIQTDAAINPGNSGGPLINLQGEIIGITMALKSTGGGYDGVGFAVPATRARRVVDDLAAYGRVRRAYLGITIRPLDATTATRLNIVDGAIVSSVVVGSPAATAGLQPGDVILTLGGQPIGGSGALQGAIEVAPVGEPLDLSVDRNGQVFSVQVRPEPQPDRFGLNAPTGPALAAEAIVPVRPPGLHINVPGLNMVVPGPNLNVTPFGVERAPRAYVPSNPGPVVVTPAPGLTPTPVPRRSGVPDSTAPGRPPTLDTEPELHPIDPVAPPEPSRSKPIETTSRSASFPTLGLNLAEATSDLADRYHLDRGTSGLVITQVDPETPADRGGLEAGMVLTDAGGKMVGKVDDFRKVVDAQTAGRDLLVRIKKGTKSEFRVVVAPEKTSPGSGKEPSVDPGPPPALPPTEAPRPL